MLQQHLHFAPSPLQTALKSTSSASTIVCASIICRTGQRFSGITVTFKQRQFTYLIRPPIRSSGRIILFDLSSYRLADSYADISRSQLVSSCLSACLANPHCLSGCLAPPFSHPRTRSSNIRHTFHLTWIEAESIQIGRLAYQRLCSLRLSICGPSRVIEYC